MLDTIFYWIGGVGSIVVLLIILGAIIYFLFCSIFPALFSLSDEYQLSQSYFFMMKEMKKRKDEKKYYEFKNELSDLIKKYSIYKKPTDTKQ